MVRRLVQAVVGLAFVVSPALAVVPSADAAGNGWTAAAAGSAVRAAAHAVRAADPGFLDAVESTRWSSPNGDGIKDKIQVGIPLEKAADVSVTVRRVGRRSAVRSVQLGRLRAGDRSWLWNGRNDRGRVVRDGRYRVTVVASRGREGVRRNRRGTGVELRTRYTPVAGTQPLLEVSRAHLHPWTRDFTDVVQIRSWQRVAASFPFGGGVSMPAQAAIEVLDPGGRVVQAWAADSDPGAMTRDWSALTPAGAPLPAGTYTVVAHYVDNFGNTGGALSRSVEVSAAPLTAQRTWSTTITAHDALTSPETWYQHCEHDCQLTCSPTPSARTSTALTVRSPDSLQRAGRWCSSAGTFAVTTPFALGQLDRVTVTAVGSEHPSPAGGTVSLELQSAWSSTRVRTTPGAARTAVGPAFHHDRSGVTDRVRWAVDGHSLGDTEYDLETFEVTVVTYAPAS